MAVELSEYQTLLTSRLKGDATLIALVPADDIQNHIPQDNQFPYIRYRLETSGEWDTKSTDGYVTSVVLDYWTDEHSDLPIIKMHEAVYDLLQNFNFVLVSGQNVLTKFKQFNTFIETDGHSHHGISRFESILTN